MKFMLSWKIAPGNIKAAAEAFLKGGAPMAEGIRLIGRWHAPGSALGWALLEAQDAAAIAYHVVEWEHLLEFQITPVFEDAEAGKALASVYGK